MATRRGVGVGAIQRRKDQQQKFKDKGTELASEQLGSLSKQLDTFSSKLEEFASNHRNEIRKNPQFRRHFQDMCASVGVDPLASSKGFWAEKLGVGDFYYELGVQIIEVCMASSHANGGMITLDEIRQRLSRSRTKTRNETVSMDDLVRAIDKLKILGTGITLIPLGNGRYLIQSVPGEINMDHTRVLQLAEESSHVTAEQLVQTLQWEQPRAAKILEDLVREGLAWVDTQGGCEKAQYWFPSLFMQLHSQSRTSSGQSRTSSESGR